MAYQDDVMIVVELQDDIAAALCPGSVNTPLLQELFAKDPERAARRLAHVPMGRFAEADEIAAAVAFLASDDA